MLYTQQQQQRVCKCTLGRLYLQGVYCIKFKAVLLRLIYIVCYAALSPVFAKCSSGNVARCFLLSVKYGGYYQDISLFSVAQRKSTHPFSFGACFKGSCCWRTYTTHTYSHIQCLMYTPRAGFILGILCFSQARLKSRVSLRGISSFFGL